MRDCNYDQLLRKSQEVIEKENYNDFTLLDFKLSKLKVQEDYIAVSLKQHFKHSEMLWFFI